MARGINPVLGYACSAAVASAFYILWLFTSMSLDDASNSTTTLPFRFGFAVFLSVFGGFVPALFLMVLPWSLAVFIERRVSVPGWIYYPSIGAVSTVLIGCATSSLAPKPLFIEDQTFIEGVILAAERQGICMCLAGLLFGTSFWFLSARRPLLVQQLK